MQEKEYLTNWNRWLGDAILSANLTISDPAQELSCENTESFYQAISKDRESQVNQKMEDQEAVIELLYQKYLEHLNSGCRSTQENYWQDSIETEVSSNSTEEIAKE